MKEATKICTKCNNELILDEFGISKNGKLGRKAECKKCISLRNKKRYIEKEEEIKEQVKNWAAGNEDKVKEYKQKYYNKVKKKE